MNGYSDNWSLLYLSNVHFHYLDDSTLLSILYLCSSSIDIFGKTETGIKVNRVLNLIFLYFRFHFMSGKLER